MSDEDASRPESGHGIFYPTIVIDGQIAGTWSRVLKKASVVIAPKPFRKLDRTELQALTLAARRYADYLELPQAQLRGTQAGAARNPPSAGRVSARRALL